MKIIRVFPSGLKKRGGSLLPNDKYAFIGDPPLDGFRPEADEVHISCTFTWDKVEAERLGEAWSQYYEVVKVGGVAYGSPIYGFTPGKYIKNGITFTSRGCNNQCPWCSARVDEGKISPLYDFPPGYIIQDNNLLQCDKSHLDRVFEMLRYQPRQVIFSGGLDSRLITDDIADSIRDLPIESVFLACDTKEAIKPLRRAVQKLHLPRRKTRCYVLLKFNDGETISNARERLELVWEAGAMPFAQLYQPKDRWINYPREWKELAREWARPAVMIASHKDED